MSRLELLGVGDAGASFTPATISGIVVWTDAQDLPASPISTWTDKSGNANHLTGVGATRPTLNATGGPNSLAAVVFDGLSQFLTVPNVLSALTAGEVFIVVKNDTYPQADATKTALWEMGTDTNTHYGFVDGLIYDEFATNGRKNSINPAVTLAAWRLYNVVSTATEWTDFLDGTQLFTTGTNTVAFSSAPLLGISGQGIHWLAGRVAEFILYNKKLSAGEKAAVKAYLATKYGLTLA